MAYAVEEARLANAKQPPTSGLGHYFNSRAQNGLEHEDIGTWLRSGFKGLKYFGPLREEDWPFDASKVNVRPSWRAYQNAFDARGGYGYYRVYGAGDDRLDAIHRAVATGHPVTFGTKVADSFLPNAGSAVIDVPRGEKIAGGHAMCIVGYEPGRFRVANSWGTDWREHGFAWLTDSYLAWEQTQDVWVLSLA
jgi:C1A family cysteine protease